MADFPERDKYELEQDLLQVEELIRRKSALPSTPQLVTEIAAHKTLRLSIKAQLAAL